MNASDEQRNGTPLLKLQGLFKDFASGNFWGRRVRVIDNVNMEVHSGEIRGIVGESGSGKTTLARCSLRLIEPSSGTVLFDGRDLASLKPSVLRAIRKEFQMIFQDVFASLNPEMTVGQILSEPLEVHGLGGEDFRDRRIRELLDSVSLAASLIHRKPSELSGGQQQRVGIARGLALKPRLLIADEPVSSLDASVQAQILNLLTDLKKQHDFTLILISHSLHAIRYMCNHISVLFRGRLVEEAPASSFFKEPRHPYSRMLLKTMSALEPVAEGSSFSVPTADDATTGIASGCAYYPYCCQRLPICGEKIPFLAETGPQEKVACFLYSQEQD